MHAGPLERAYYGPGATAETIYSLVSGSGVSTEHTIFYPLTCRFRQLGGFFLFLERAAERRSAVDI